MIGPLFALAVALSPPAPGADAGTPDRPSEEDLFGTSGPPDQSPEPLPGDGGLEPRPGEQEIFGVPVAGPAADAGVESSEKARDQAILVDKLPYEAEDLAPSNPLTVGGLLYLRTQLSASQGQPPSQYYLSAPSLMDTYLDARPNDRVRGFVLVRTLFDPTFNPNQPTPAGLVPPSVANPDFLLDQMWIKFDVAHEVFVTAGRQHVKWGAAHFWFPNDLLNPVRLQPLAVFDQRTGVTMIKANLPLSDEHLNVYGMGLFEGYQPADQLGALGGAARVEYVLGAAEVGVDMVGSEGMHNRYGGDLSFGILDVDLYAEWAFTDGIDVPLWKLQPLPPGFPPGLSPLPGIPEEVASPGYRPQVATGANYSLRYGNNRVLTFGAEYFYNGFGYTDPSIYPLLFLTGDATFFYLGQQYLGLYLLADKPGSWYNSTINLSTIGNLSDHSWISRIDFFQMVLTHLRVEAFAQVHYGGDGEFHLSLNLPASSFGGVSIPAIQVGAPVFDTGLALRMAF